MGSLLNFIVNQRDGLFLLLVLLFALGLFANWLLWMLGLGRFARKGVADTSKVRFVVADFFVKIINDFRHLLALLIVLLFALALFTAMWPGISKQEVGLIKDGLQAVAAALGG